MSERRRHSARHLLRDPGNPVAARAALAGMCCWLATATVVRAEPQPPETPPAESAAAVVQAVWKAQSFDFHYQSFTTFYSCSSLGEKVRRVLLELGSDPRTRVRVSGCEFGSGIARMPVVRITTSSPVEATPAALAELEKTRSVRELAARVRNDTEKVEIDRPFPAH